MKLDLGPGGHRIVARAVDSSADSHPKSAGEVSSFEGYANNSWHGVRVRAR